MKPARLRVLLIVEACNPTFTSVPLVGYNMAKALAVRSDLDVTIVTHVRNRDALEADILSSIARVCFIDNESIARPLYRLSSLIRGGENLSWTTSTAMAWPSYMYFEKKVFAQFQREFQGNYFHIIHRITPLSPTMGSPLASLVKTPMVIGPLNGGLPWPEQYPELRAKEREWLVPIRNIYKALPFFKSTYQRAAAIISGSQHTATEIPTYFKGKRYLIPENGIDTERFPLVSRWSSPSGRFRFITVGRLVPLKGIDMILEAMGGSELLRHCELCIAGDGPERGNLEEQTRALGLKSNVRFAGWQSQLELADELRHSQAFVFPSLRDFGGGVVLEAMACGLPCIVTDYGGPAELIDSNCGILIPMLPRSEIIPHLARAMERLVANPDQCSMFGKNGVSRVRSEFTWEVKAEKLINIYRDVLSLH